MPGNNAGLLVPSSFQRSAADANSKTHTQKENGASNRKPNAVAFTNPNAEHKRKPKLSKPKRLPVTGDSDDHARR